jgi:hypothetical protein
MIAAIMALFFAKRRKALPTNVEATYRAGYSIPVTDKMLEAELQDNEEVMKLLEARIIASCFFRAEKIPELVAKIRLGFSPFARLNTKVAFEGNEVLTVEEKKSLGLNTRMKYSKAFIEYFDPTTLRNIEPKALLEDMHLDAFHRVARKRDLLKFRDLGFVKQVKIVPVGDERDCDKIKRFKKIHDIGDVPELPLPGCTAPYCRCMYEPVISELL